MKDREKIEKQLKIDPLCLYLSHLVLKQLLYPGMQRVLAQECYLVKVLQLQRLEVLLVEYVEQLF